MTPDDIILEELTKVLDLALLFLGILAVLIVIILIVASKIIREDLEWIDHLTMNALTFVWSAMVFVIVTVGVTGLMRSTDLLQEDQVALIGIIIFTSSVVFLFLPILWIIRNSFMFLTPRVIVAGVYAVMIATLLTMFVMWEFTDFDLLK